MEYYLYIKAIHLSFVMFWMAGMFYLPRLYAYHAEVKIGSESDLMFQKMEKRLLRIIMNPCMIVAVFLGLVMTFVAGVDSFGKWIHLKVLLVLFLLTYHGFLAKCRRDFEYGLNKRSSKFYRIFNEISPILVLIIVFLAVVKPF